MKTLIKSAVLASVIGLSTLPVLSMASTLNIKYVGDLNCVATGYSVGTSCTGQSGQSVSGIPMNTAAQLTFTGRINPLTFYGAANQNLTVVATALVNGGPIMLNTSSQGNTFSVSTDGTNYVSNLSTVQVNDGTTLYVKTTDPTGTPSKK